MSDDKKPKCDTSTSKDRSKVYDLTSDSEEDLPLPITIKSKSVALGVKRVQSSYSEKSVNGKSQKHAEDETGGASNMEAPKEKKVKRLKLATKKRPRPDVAEIFGTTSELDQTSDFAGGFTPYKILAEKKLSRSKRSANTSQRASKEDKSQTETNSTKPRERKNQSSTAGVVHNDKNGTKETEERDKKETVKTEERDNRETVKTEERDKKKTVEIDESQVSQESGSEETSGKIPPTKDEATERFCTICGGNIQLEDKDHIKHCLQGRFQFRAGSSRTETKAQKQDNKENMGTVDYLCCQVCQEDITSLSPNSRSTHVNACIDQTANSSKMVAAVSSSSSSMTMTCHICKRDLTELNSHRQQQHINFCVDKHEKQKKEQEEALKKAQNKVLECPLCGKPLQTQASRRTHMKQCALSLGVNTGLLQERIKQQQEEYQLQLAAGILPPQQPKTSRPRNSRRRRPANDGPTERPVVSRHMDADTELAIALSTSLAEQQKIEAALTGKSEVVAVEMDPQKANAFNILMTPKAKVSKRGRKNKGPEKVPELLLQSKEDLQRHLASRLEFLFAQSSSLPGITSTPPSNISKIRDKYSAVLQENDYKIDQKSSWWTLTKLIGNQSGDSQKESDKENEQKIFYVEQLMPPLTISRTRPKVRIQEPVLNSPQENKVNLANKTTANETLIATTQTAVYLAELATESGNSTLNMTTAAGNSILEQTQAQDESKTGLQIDQNSPVASHPLIKEDVVSQEHNCLLDQLGVMVNNPLMSDLQIKVKNGTLHAHKFMFATRCLNVQQDLETNTILDLPDFDSATVKSVLTYIYTGAVPQSSPDIAKVASRWKMKVLLQLLNENHEPPENIAETTQANLDEILKNIWGSDYEDSDSENEADKIQGPNEQDMEEACNFVLTQRRTSQRKEEDENESDENEEEKINKEEDGEIGNCSFNKLNMTAVDMIHELAKIDCETATESSSGDEDLAKPLWESPEPAQSEKEKVCQTRKQVDIHVSDSDNEIPNEDEQARSEERQDYDNPAVVSCDSDQSDKLPESIFTQNRGERTLSSVLPSSSNDSLDQPMDPLMDTSPKNSHKRPHRKIVSESIDLTGNDDNLGIQPPSPTSIGSDSELDKLPNLPYTEEFHTENDPKSPEPDTYVSDSPGKYASSENLNEIVENKELEPASDEQHDPMGSPYECNSPFSVGNLGSPMTPVLFDGSPQMPKPLEEDYMEDKEPRPESVNKTIGSNVSELDLFDVESSCEEEDGNEEKAPDSPVFQSIRANTSRIMESNTRTFQFAEDRRNLEVQKEDNESNDCVITEVQNQGSFVSSQTKRKRSLSGSSQEDISVSQSKKKSRIGSSGEDIPGSPVYGRTSQSKVSSQLTVPRVQSDLHTEESNHTDTSETSQNKATNSDSNKKDDDNSQGACTISSDSDLELAPIPEMTPPSDHDDYANTPSGDDINTLDLTLDEEEIGGGVIVEECKGDERSPERISPRREASYYHDMSLSQPPTPEATDPPQDAEVDVWSDFDDVGFTEEFIMPNTQTLQGSGSATGSTEDKPTEFKTPVSQRKLLTGQPMPDFDPPTDMDESDLSILEDEPSPFSSDHRHTVETPKVRQRKPALPPSPFTPMPDYDNMVTPEVKKACLNYGVRVMPKKRMVKLLKNIYENTHQYETDSECEQSFTAPSTSAPTSRATTQDKEHRSKSQPGVSNKQSTKPAASRKSATQASASAARPYVMSDSDEEDDGLLSQPIPTQFTEDPTEDLPEESFIGTQAEPSEKGKDKQSTVEAKRLKIKEHILGNEDRYLQILNYKPLEFDAYHQQLKDVGIKAGTGVVMDFLDDMNIQFTMRKSKEDKQEGRTQRRGGGGRGGGGRGGGGRGGGHGRGRGARRANAGATATS